MAVRFLHVLRQIFTFPIRVYQKLISPGLPNACIYEPSCSEYTRQSILRHGILPGLILGATRIFRCNSSFFIGGADNVPRRFRWIYIRAAYHHHRRFRRRKRTR